MRVRKNDKLFVVIAVIVIIAMIVLAIVINVKSKDNIDYSKMTEEEIAAVVEEQVNEMEKNDLGEMGERDRMEHYVASFIEAIENKEYEDAYEMLYDDFKKNYFPNYADFEEYAKNKFPSMISVEHTNFERNGDVYVLWTKLSNPMGSKNSAIEINFVVKENDLNDFDISFKIF